LTRCVIYAECVLMVDLGLVKKKYTWFSRMEGRQRIPSSLIIASKEKKA